MQPELPWNVAGIPSEARDAARAAARREGLSVGEWMTRRILRGFPDATTDANDNWRANVIEPPLPLPAGNAASAQETEEMLARVSRSEAESQNAYKALDHQLKTVAQRLESAEQTQTENSRAMTQAATQINIAAREQAQAFEQLNAHVASLAERLVRLEQYAQNDGSKDAIKALHNGLSRVADQIAQTASQSAAQIAALAGNVDSLATQVVSANDKADGACQAVEAHVVSLDERIRVVERTAYASASALDHTMENVERLRADKDSVESDVRQHGAAVAQMKDVFDHLTARISATEAEHTRIEEAVTRIRAPTTDETLDRRLSSIEHVLTDIMGRLDQTEHESASQTGTVEQTLHDLAAGFEVADQRNRETIRDLQSSVHDTASKLAAIEEKLSAVPATAPASPQPAEKEHVPAPEFTAPKLLLDMPHFDDAPVQTPDVDLPPLAHEPSPDFLAHRPAADFQHLALSDAPPPLADHEPASADSSDPSIGQAEPAPLGAPISFLDAARRSANVAAADKEPAAAEGSMHGFAWRLPSKDDSASPSPDRKRYALAGSIFGVAVAAALTGVVLSHSMGSSEPAHSQPRAAVSLALPQHLASAPVATLPKTASATLPATVPLASSAAKSESTAARLQDKPARLVPSPQVPKQASSVTAQSATVPLAPPQKLAALANTGDSKAQLLLGLRYLEGNGVAANEAEAARWLSRAAQQGEPLAQYRLGTLYERGRGVAVSAKQAAHWYELAAKQGNRKAMHNLAIAFAEGSGEAKDPVQAAMWFTRAADLGLADSQFNLAVLYERGMGVKQNLVDAYKWYLIAGAQGDTESKTRAEALSSQLSNADRAAAQQAATTFKPQPLDPSSNSAPVFG